MRQAMEAAKRPHASAVQESTVGERQRTSPTMGAKKRGFIFIRQRPELLPQQTMTTMVTVEKGCKS